MHRLVPKTHGLVQARSQKWYKLVQVARPDADFWCKMHTVHCKSSSCTFLVHELLLQRSTTNNTARVERTCRIWSILVRGGLSLSLAGKLCKS